MDKTYITPFTRALLTSVFTGIVATVLCLFYNIAYRDSSGFALSDFINVSSLIFAVNLIFLVVGLMYSGFLRLSKLGEFLFVALLLVLTVVLSFFAANVHRSDVPLLNTEFHHLLLPMIVGMGLLAALGIPFLYRNKAFQDAVI